jgi:hypothetical protein
MCALIGTRRRTRATSGSIGVLFETAIEVFDDSNCVVEQDREIEW